MAKKQIIIDAPKHPVVRYIFRDERHVVLDLRGIRNPHSPFNGRLNPSKGAPRKFLSPEHLQSMVNEYFESCNGPLIDRNGNLVYDANGNLVKTQVKPYTVSGLALYLDISTTTMKKYQEGKIDDILEELKADTDDKLTFAKVITRAKHRVEAYAESRLYDKDGSNGAKFVLDCCYGWVGNAERSQIKLNKMQRELRQAEFDLKKKLIDEEASDGEITINIVRREKQNET